MKCLAVNTATSICSVALIDGAQTLYSHHGQENRDQGTLLLRQIKAALHDNAMTFADLDLLAAVTGPGSFTGIRIGLAALRGIALASGKPIAGVSSFDMFRVPHVVNVVAVESWREELYFKVFAPEGTTLIAPVNEAPADFARRMEAIAQPCVVSGDAAEKMLPFLSGALSHGEMAGAVGAAHVAMARWQAGHPLEKPSPFYLRPADITLPKSALYPVRGKSE